MKALLLALLAALTAPAQPSSPLSKAMDDVITEAVRKDRIPGAVLLVGQNGKVVYFTAYGNRALAPSREPMTTDTVFDAASLTKVIATTPCIMKLFEEGKIRLNDKATEYLPEFQGGKSDITIRQMLTHFSGLRPFVPLKPEETGYDTALRRMLADKAVSQPGEKFIYSDTNFILLAEIVKRLTGKTVAEYARETVFEPLGMKDTMFLPPDSLKPRIAPTEVEHGVVLRGVVHDERSRAMGGVAGHAGLFTTAEDLSKFAGMMLGMGQRDGVRIFQPETVRKFTTPQTPPDQPILRGLGWDIDSPYSGNRGELYPIGSYGHTGFTGTSIWIDPFSQSYVILLANSVHPHRRPAITALRGKVATIAAAACGIQQPGVLITGYNETMTGAGIHRPVARNGRTMTGLDVLAAEKFAPLQGKRVGLITNHTGITRDGKRNVDAMTAAGVNVTALFSPEHGFAGIEDRENVGGSLDKATGIRIFSLYEGKNRRPSDEMLRLVDVLVFDIQDIGARFYTYISTMKYCMEEAGKRGIPFYVLDRPNPITGVKVEGPMLDPELASFIGCYPMPVRHGMTAGELARMMNAGLQEKANLTVVEMRDWQRGDWFDSTGLPWINPSPNMRSLDAALLYPGVALMEASANYSVGRGTDDPFEQIGASWIRGAELAGYLNQRMVPGARFYPIRFTPVSSNFKGTEIEGMRIVITDREALDAGRLGLEIAAAVQKLYPGKINWQENSKLIGNRATVADVEAGADPRAMVSKMEDERAGFLARREKYLIYR